MSQSTSSHLPNGGIDVELGAVVTETTSQAVSMSCSCAHMIGKLASDVHQPRLRPMCMMIKRIVYVQGNHGLLTKKNCSTYQA